MDETKALNRVSIAFVRLGILLESDRRFPSVVGLTLGRNIQGSWWGLANSHAIFRILKKFASRRDNLATKLVSGKVTFVHRSLWHDLLAIAVAREAWQMQGLSKTARSLLAAVEKKRETTTMEAEALIRAPVGDAARELERRLLVQSEEFHTERGFHAKRLRSWIRWSESAHFTGPTPPVSRAKSRLERRLAEINSKYRAKGRLPWQRPRSAQVR